MYFAVTLARFDTYPLLVKTRGVPLNFASADPAAAAASSSSRVDEPPKLIELAILLATRDPVAPMLVSQVFKVRV